MQIGWVLEMLHSFPYRSALWVPPRLPLTGDSSQLTDGRWPSGKQLVVFPEPWATGHLITGRLSQHAVSGLVTWPLSRTKEALPAFPSLISLHHILANWRGLGPYWLRSSIFTKISEKKKTRATHETENKEQWVYMLLQNRLLLYFWLLKSLFLDHFGVKDYEHLFTMWVPSLTNFCSLITQRSSKVNTRQHNHSFGN